MERRPFLQLFGTGISALFGRLVPVNLFNADHQGLPKILILGDSISIGYTPYVQEILSGKAIVVRPVKVDGSPENCAGTTNGIQHIDRWIGDTNWAVIHYNFGLHDLKHVDPKIGKNSTRLEDPRQAEPKQYRRNLKVITKKLKATGAKLIYATTTPYPEKQNGPLREYGDAETYNKLALKIMKRNQIQINDLYSYVLPRIVALQRPTNVHFTDEGSKKLAEQVAASINQILS